jgi:uncharacterized protein (TIGR02246 family)
MTQDDQQQIRNAINRWLTASREGDLATLTDLMTDDIVFLTPGNPPMHRLEFEARYRAMAGKVNIQGKPDVREITVNGDIAVCWNYLEITITPEGAAPVRHAGNVLSVFQRGADGQWRLWRDANLLAPSTP